MRYNVFGFSFKNNKYILHLFFFKKKLAEEDRAFGIAQNIQLGTNKLFIMFCVNVLRLLRVKKIKSSITFFF